jgi:predicted nucleic acid-binding protein
MRRVVSNTGPLLHLSEASDLDLLSLMGEVHIPRGVEREIAYHISTWITPAWITVDALDEPHATDSVTWQQAGLLQIGEAEAIALARQLEVDWLLTDDAAARLVAQKLGLEVHGSLGVVIWAVATGHLNHSEAKSALERLARSSLWISARVLAEARLALERLFQE